MRLHLRRWLLLLSFLVPGTGAAQPIVPAPPRWIWVDIGTRLSFLQIMLKVATFLAVTAAIVCTGLFIVGALFLTASRGKDDMVQKGRDLMTGSILGVTVVLGSYAILRTVFYVLYVL